MTQDDKEKLFKKMKSRFINSTGLAGERFKFGLEYYLKGIEDILKVL